MGDFFVLRTLAKDLANTNLLAQAKTRHPARSLLPNHAELTKQGQMAP
jgi:hypothetical protein